MSTKNLADRMLVVIQAKTESKRRFKEMEELTGIPSDRWSAFSLGRQRPTAEMIEAVCKAWPQYAFWISLGITDPENGHVAPTTIDSFCPIVRGIEQEFATAEFKYLLSWLEREPKEKEELLLRRREIEDSVLKAREKDILPAIYVSYEKVVRELGENGKSDFFIVETNHEIREIRRLRNEGAERVRKQIKEWRGNLIVSKAIDKAMKFLLNSFTKSRKG